MAVNAGRVAISGGDPAFRLPWDAGNLILHVNRYAGGGEGGHGAKMGDTYEAELRALRPAGWSFYELNPERPDEVLLGADRRMPLREFLHHRPSRNLFRVNTIPAEPDKRIALLAQALKVFHENPRCGRTCITAVAGDGGNEEVRTAGDISVGLPPEVLFARTMEAAEIRRRREGAPILDAARGGTACDFSEAVGARRDSSLVERWLHGQVVGLPTVTSQVELEDGVTKILDSSHTLLAGDLAVLFALAELLKNFPGFRGTKNPFYLMAGALLVGKASAFMRRAVMRTLSLDSLPDPVDPFWVDYDVNGGAIQMEHCSNYLVSPLQMIAGLVYSPRTPVEGAMAFLLPALTMGLLTTFGEALVRGKAQQLTRKITKHDLDAIILGKRLRTISQGQQRPLQIGDLTEARFYKKKGGDPAYIPWVANGEPQLRSDAQGKGVGGIHAVRSRVGEGYPYLVSVDSPVARRQRI